MREQGYRTERRSRRAVLASGGRGLVAAGLLVCAGGIASAADAAEAFTQEAAARGVTYNIERADTFGCGIAFADLDNDGDPDLVLVGKVTLGEGDTTTVGVYENDGTGQFTDRSDDSGCPMMPYAVGVTAADYDGDGDLDLHVTNWGFADVLLRNDGEFVFTEVGVAMGIDNTGAGSGCGWGDIDGDTWLDLYVANRTITNHPITFDYLFELNALYHNLGNGTGFEDVAVALGVEASRADTVPPSDPPLTGDRSFQGSFFDYDNDGDPDLYLSNDKGLSSQEDGPCTWRNRMWENQGDGTFLDISASSSTDGCIDAMCVALGDIDRNGYQDIYVTNLGGSGPPGTNGQNALYMNQGDGTFLEMAQAYGVASAPDNNPTAEVGWGSVFFDYDNDGYLDLYVCNINGIEPNRLFDFDGTLPATNVAVALGVADVRKTYTCAVADIDNDGDLDLAIANVPLSGQSTPVRLLINNEGENRTWAKFNVIGTGGNRFAVGAQVRVRTGTVWQMREVIAGENFKSQNDLTMHFGLDTANVVDEIEVMWPGGLTRTLTGYGSGSEWTLHHPSQLGDVDGDGVVGPDDFAAFAACYDQPLSPGCEVMDMNGDGIVDAGDTPDFLAAWGGPLEDCNDNGVTDLEDILAGTSADANGDAVPDECIAADVNQDGYVDVNDLVAVITQWGPCPGCAEDVNDDGFVDVNDLVEIIVNWG